MTACVLALVLWLMPSASAPVVDLGEEPNHHVLLQNADVRVFRLVLQPNQATLPHKHKGFFVSIALGATTLANEVRGRQPVTTELEQGEVRTSRGGFNVAERNMTAATANVIVIEPLAPGETTNTAPARFHFHDTAVGELFEAGGMRAYTVRMASGGYIEARTEDHDCLLVALDDLNIRDEGAQLTDLHLKAGDVDWIKRGTRHLTKNTGATAVSYVVFEFLGIRGQGGEPRQP
jgi:hypothetical protein